jgi:MHS family proline/betaine transporter-like MFS transporter
MQKRAMWTVCGTAIIWNAGGYVLLAYLPVFAAQVLKLDLSIGLAATSIGTLVRAVLTPLVGSLSDRIGRKPIVQTVNIAFFVLAYPMFPLAQDRSRLHSMLVVSSVAGRGWPWLVARAGDAVRAVPDQLAFNVHRHRLNISAAMFGGFLLHLHLSRAADRGRDLANPISCPPVLPSASQSSRRSRTARTCRWRNF